MPSIVSQPNYTGVSLRCFSSIVIRILLMPNDVVGMSICMTLSLKPQGKESLIIK